MRSGHLLVLGTVALAGGCLWVAALSLSWYLSQGFVVGQQAALAAVLGFYYLEVPAIMAALLGSWAFFRGLAEEGKGAIGSVRSALAEALSDKWNVRVGAVAGALYGVAYLFLSSVVVYQPAVSFALAGGASGPEVAAAACCGSPGTVPELLVILSQQWHLGLQILPLDAFFAAVIPVLVGFNVAVAAHALKSRVLRSKTGWLGPVGILAGLFTGCPTCAGVFLAGTIGGAGATTLAVALAPYQLVFVALTIPVLVASPCLISYFAGKAALASCAVPVPAIGEERAETLRNL